MIGDAGEHVGDIVLRVETVELGALDQRIDRRGAAAAGIGASEQIITAESWVGTGPNKPVTPPQLEQAIGPEVLETLSKQTGLSREDLLARLSRELPDAVDKYTPQGRLPTETDFTRS
jgi:uncharacterized protein YidB (DUF937 family)